MTPAHPALLAAAALLVCARAEIASESPILRLFPNDRIINNTSERETKSYTSGRTDLPSACLYDNRWHHDGDTVPTREDCLHCTCVRGALSCRRQACKPLPDPLPRRCHVRHGRGACCPELHCPDGVIPMIHGALARFEDENVNVSSTPPPPNTACVEGGTVFAAGSAMASRVACEQCFCLAGARRCVRPTCLPPPPHCAPRPAPGACCPQRYYCDRTTDKPGEHRNQYDCLLDDDLVPEGARVPSRTNCSACFCLRGEVRCQALGCAPALVGCKPLLAPGECCAHQYICKHDDEERSSPVIMALKTSLNSMRYDERAFHSIKSAKIETTTKTMITNLYTLKHTPIASATKNHLITTAKVKRKTEEPLSSSQKPEQDTDTKPTNMTTTEKPQNAAKLIAADNLIERTTEQPEGTVKIVINGTINCTAELSSTSLPLNINPNDTDKIQMEAMPRVPIVNVEAQTYSPNDIITDRNVNDGFDENDTFTINVTSSLMTNTSHSTSKPIAAKIPIPEGLAEALNISKKNKGEYDYDYTEPTLPPSLPNLKIIPFVAADAVVEDVPSKDTVLTYPMLEREDKFPVYYPTADTKNTAFPTRREDYQPTQYPVFVDKEPSYPPISHDVHLTGNRYPEHNDLGVHEYTVSATLGSHVADVNAVTKLPTTSTTFALKTPAVNLFSPPVETEGGFVPKDVGILNEYFAAFPTTTRQPTRSTSVPSLTTSMQLNVLKGECIASNGQRVPGGQSAAVGCDTCTCSWVELTCAPPACAAPPGCARLPHGPSSADPCCGDLLCQSDNNTVVVGTTGKHENKQNVTKSQVINKPSQVSTPAAKNNTSKTTASNEKVANKETSNTNKVNKPAKKHPEPTRTTTTAAPVTTTKPVRKVTTTTTTTRPGPIKGTNDTFHDYDEDDDEDEFSFGSVLKLLLSDTYETTTAANKKLSTTTPPIRRPIPIAHPTYPALPTEPSSSSPPPTTMPTTPSPSTESFFKPLPPLSYAPLKISLNTVNRIDHLVLGEATAIKRTSPRPIINKVSKRPSTTDIDSTTDVKDESIPMTSLSSGGSRPPSLGVGAGLLKLAGCNIYGRMYRVGRIITELSTPCQECWCTELGVQCKPLDC